MQHAITVFVFLDDLDNHTEQIQELNALVKASESEVVETLIQHRESPDPRTYIGKGKVEELRMMIEAHKPDFIVFDDELSGSTMRNLYDLLGIKIVDRTMLIMDIFARRTHSLMSQYQVELAQLQYRKSHLRGMGNILSQQGAGIGTRGPGETKLETDRRNIDNRIAELRRKIKEQQKTVELQRKTRSDNEQKIVALVGYTNSGKSTMMNHLLGHYESDGGEVFVKDMLFATLDTFVRRIEIDNARHFLLVDTVGFVNKLPHQLIEAFKSTLEEIREADLVLHILDSSDDNLTLQHEATLQVLEEIDALDIPRLTILNKWDKPEKFDLVEADLRVSSKTGYGMDNLEKRVISELFGATHEREFLLGYEDFSVKNNILERSQLLDESYTDEGNLIKVLIDDKWLEKYRIYLHERT